MIFGTENYFFYFILYSIIGWGYETALCSVRDRAFVNRGFLNGPYCPIYGVGAVLFLVLLGKEKSALLIFLFGGVIASAIEFATSYAMEKAFGARWWDYSDYPFNLDGRICLGAAAVFGTFAVVLIKLLHPAIVTWVRPIPSIIFHVVNAVAAITFLCDLAVTLKGFKLRKLNENGDTEKAPSGKESFIPISRQEKRLLRAFPNMRSEKYGKALENMRFQLNNNKKGLEKNSKR